MSLPVPSTPTYAQLTKKQKAFVDALFENGGDKEQAALEAGYAKASARTQAYQILHSPNVAQAILERTAIELASAAPSAALSIRTLAGGAKSEYVRLQAAQDLLDRIGMRAPEKHDHRIAGDISVHIDLG